MTDAEVIAEVSRHWEHWAGHLGLTNWWTKIAVNPAVEEHHIEVAWHGTVEGYRRFTLQFPPNLMEDSGNLTRWPLSQSILHEAFHVVLDRLSTVALQNMGKEMYKEYEAAEEGVVDMLTMIYLRLHAATDCKL